MFGLSSVFEKSIWWQFRIGQEKSTPYDKALLLLGNRLKESHPKSPLNLIRQKKKQLTDCNIFGKLYALGGARLNRGISLKEIQSC